MMAGVVGRPDASVSAGSQVGADEAAGDRLAGVAVVSQPLVPEPLVPEPRGGARYRTTMRVRLADADPEGRMRFDAIARFLQDVSTEDTERSEHHAGLIWVARRITIDVVRFPEYLETLELATWCGGVGGRWAERRVSIRGDGGAAVEAATLWVLVDGSGTPTKLPDDLVAQLRETAGDRKVSARLTIPGPDAACEERGPWVVRRCDLDLMGHANNAGLWAVAEADLGDLPVEPPAPLRAQIEFSREVLAGDALTVLRSPPAPEAAVGSAWSGVRRWWLRSDAGVHAAIAVGPR